MGSSEVARPFSESLNAHKQNTSATKSAIMSALILRDKSVLERWRKRDEENRKQERLCDVTFMEELFVCVSSYMKLRSHPILFSRWDVFQVLLLITVKSIFIDWNKAEITI